MGVGLGIRLFPLLRIAFLFLPYQPLELVRALARATKAGQQGFCEFLHRGIARLGVGVERREHHVIDISTKIFHAQRGNDDLGIVDGVFRFGDAIRQKRILARDHLVGKACQRPFVAALVQLLLLHLFGRHIADGTALRSAVAGFAGQARQAEIGHLHVAFLVDEHVVGLDVQVKHVMRMRCLQSAGHRFEHRADNIDIHVVGVFGEQLPQRYAIDVFHDEVRHAVLHLEVVHLHDGGIGELRRGSRLFEPRHGRGIHLVAQKDTAAFGEQGSGRFIQRHAFDGNAPFDARVPRRHNRSEPALAGLAFKHIATQQQIALGLGSGIGFRIDIGSAGGIGGGRRIRTFFFPRKSEAAAPLPCRAEPERTRRGNARRQREPPGLARFLFLLVAGALLHGLLLEGIDEVLYDGRRSGRAALARKAVGHQRDAHVQDGRRRRRRNGKGAVGAFDFA